MKPFTLTAPTDPAEAVRLVASAPDAAFLGGGTNLVDHLKLGVTTPGALVDVTHATSAEITDLPDGSLRVGAAVRNSDLAADPRARERCPVLVQALLAGASGQAAPSKWPTDTETGRRSRGHSPERPNPHPSQTHRHRTPAENTRATTSRNPRRHTARPPPRHGHSAGHGLFQSVPVTGKSRRRPPPTSRRPRGLDTPTGRIVTAPPRRAPRDLRTPRPAGVRRRRRRGSPDDRHRPRRHRHLPVVHPRRRPTRPAGRRPEQRTARRTHRSWSVLTVTPEKICGGWGRHSPMGVCSLLLVPGETMSSRRGR